MHTAPPAICKSLSLAPSPALDREGVKERGQCLIHTGAALPKVELYVLNLPNTLGEIVTLLVDSRDQSLALLLLRRAPLDIHWCEGTDVRAPNIVQNRTKNTVSVLFTLSSSLIERG